MKRILLRYTVDNLNTKPKKTQQWSVGVNVTKNAVRIPAPGNGIDIILSQQAIEHLYHTMKSVQTEFEAML